jgi:hypothetical protein
MKKDYTRDVEKHNESLQQKLEETLTKLEMLEKEKEMFDFLPTFVINYNAKSPIPNYVSEPFIHQNITSTLEVMIDWIGDGILTDIERHNKTKRRAVKLACQIDMKCWYLGSLERTYGISVYFIGKGKYDVATWEVVSTGMKPSWDDEEESFYLSKVPSCKEVEITILEALRDCKVMSKHIKDK